ncbi:MAG: DUF4097 domain-containing protein [Actinomycetota bacterium]|nr:DUF4097 domain-containing protein [Actinomycetota bacterium]
MPTFETPEPINADLDVEVGSARLIAAERSTTVVDVRPANARRRADVEAAEATQVHFAGGRLEVKGPMARKLGLFGRPGAIAVVVELPTGSEVRGQTAWGDFDTVGRLGDCSFKTSYGSLRVEEVGAVDLHTASGEITVGRVAGAAEISSSSGNIRVGESGGDAEIKTAAGDIRVQKARAGVRARTAYGQVRVAEAERGVLTLATSYGGVEVGVIAGTATFLDLTSGHGKVRNELEQSDDGPRSAETLTVRARTSYGDITIRRA